MDFLSGIFESDSLTSKSLLSAKVSNILFVTVMSMGGRWFASTPGEANAANSATGNTVTSSKHAGIHDSRLQMIALSLSVLYTVYNIFLLHLRS